MLSNLQYGDPEGVKIVYFFGVPGSPFEASIFNDSALTVGINVIALDRAVSDSSMSNEDYLQELCRRVVDASGDHPIRLVGFSIGASIALRVAAILGNKVEAIYLLSPAAPLEIKGNTEGMGAGRYTFLLAERYPTLFAIFGWYQALLSRFSPAILLRLLFSGSRGKDAELMANPDTRIWLENIQKTCFRDGISVYDRDVKLYVEPWSEILCAISSRVSIWHGEADNWAPIAMSDYLDVHLENVVLLKKCNELSHYSCLIENAHEVMSIVYETSRLSA